MSNLITKASFRLCPPQERVLFPQSKCLIPISIGQKHHENEKFRATIKLVNASFRECTILIDDVLQRHTRRIGTNASLDQLYASTLQEGEDWLQRHEEIIESLTIPYHIIRWEKFLKHPKFPGQLSTIIHLYETKPDYKKALDATAIEFLKRYQEQLDTHKKDQPIPFDYDLAFAYCIEYLKEECAGFCLWVDEGCEFEVYPSGRNEAMAATYEEIIKPVTPHLLRSVGLRFKKFNPPPQRTNILNTKEGGVQFELALKNIMSNMLGHIYWKDKNGVYLGCNDAQAISLGFKSGEEIVGKTDFDLPWKRGYAEIYFKNDLEVMKSGQPKLIEEKAVINGKPGIVLSQKTPLRDEEENILGVMGISIDITALKLAEENLKKINEEKINTLSILKNMMAALPSHVYWKDRNGVYLGCNDAQAITLGLKSGDDIVGKTDFDLPWLKEDAEVYRKNDLEVINTGQTRFIEERALINGKQGFVLSQKTPLKNQSGEIIGILGISSDITTIKKTEEELRIAKEKAEAASQAKTAFLENMRHDIRTPLSGIIGFANLIKDTSDKKKIDEYASNLSASGQTLLNLLNSVLESIKVSTGEIPILKKKFDLKSLLDNVICLTQAKAKQKNLELTLDYDSKIPHYLVGDPIRIHRIILELVSNALNFTNKGSVQIKASLEKPQEKGLGLVINLSVSDTGVGMTVDQQQELFVRFKRLTPSYQGIYKGTGLGLFIIKQFIDELDGEISVKSEQNQGSTLTCLIPLKQALTDDATGVEQKFELETGVASSVLQSGIQFITSTQIQPKIREIKEGSKNKILLVEDNPIAIAVTRNMLMDLQCEIDVARDGNEALQLFKTNPYELIFMDIGLPDLDGYEVTRQIRDSEGIKENLVPIIALSAHTDIDSKKRCIEAGMNAVLSKPLLKEQAQDVLNAFIISRQSKKQKTKSKSQSMAATPKKESDLLKIEGLVLDFEYTQRIGFPKETIIKLLPIVMDSLNKDLPKLKEAYEKQDYKTIGQIAHKLKGGALYCGALRLKEVSSRLEDYMDEKTQPKPLLSQLYGLLLKESEDLIKEITKILKKGESI